MNVPRSILLSIIACLGVAALHSCDTGVESDGPLTGKWNITFDSLGNGSIDLYQYDRRLAAHVEIGDVVFHFKTGDLYPGDDAHISMYTENVIWSEGQPVNVLLTGKLNYDWHFIDGEFTLFHHSTQKLLLRDSLTMHKEHFTFGKSAR